MKRKKKKVAVKTSYFKHINYCELGAIASLARHNPDVFLSNAHTKVDFSFLCVCFTHLKGFPLNADLIRNESKKNI